MVNLNLTQIYMRSLATSPTCEINSMKNGPIFYLMKHIENGRRWRWTNALNAWRGMRLPQMQISLRNLAWRCVYRVIILACLRLMVRYYFQVLCTDVLYSTSINYPNFVSGHIVSTAEILTTIHCYAVQLWNPESILHYQVVLAFYYNRGISQIVGWWNGAWWCTAGIWNACLLEWRQKTRCCLRRYGLQVGILVNVHSPSRDHIHWYICVCEYVMLGPITMCFAWTCCFVYFSTVLFHLQT